MVIRKINPWSCAKVAGIVYALMGLLIGGIFSVVGMGIGSLAGGEHMPMAGMLLGGGALVALPIFYGVIGAITTAIGAVIYNVVAGMIGGIEIEVTMPPGSGGLPAGQ